MTHLRVAMFALFVFVCSSATAETRIWLSSDPGDFIGAGQTYYFDDSSGTYYGPGSAYFFYTLFPPSPQLPWFFIFSPPQGTPLAEGVYQAQRCPYYASPTPCMDVFGRGAGCNKLSGHFDVRHLRRDSSGQIVAAWIVFEQHCEGATPALRGDIRLNYSPPQDIPFLGPGATGAFVLLVLGAGLVRLGRVA